MPTWRTLGPWRLRICSRQADVAAFNPGELLHQHRLYDQYVDVVAAFEWLFTETKDMPETVTHFERFPRVNAKDGHPATPDFSVVFSDGSGLVGEIARIALIENSVDDLCRQMGRYDSLEVLPTVVGVTPVEWVDVLLLVPLDIGTEVVRRVLIERYANPDHIYKPVHPPCVIQYVAQSDRYVFQRRPDPGNGGLRDGDREPGLGSWLSRADFKPPASGFAHVKSKRPFINDPVAPLYLACQLWTKLFPTLTVGIEAVGDYKPLIISTQVIAKELSTRYGRVDRTAIRNAMGILVASRCAEALAPDKWRVAWGDLAHKGGEDVGEALARRTAKPPAKGPIRRLIQAYSDLGRPDPVRALPPEPGQLF